MGQALQSSSLSEHFSLRLRTLRQLQPNQLASAVDDDRVLLDSIPTSGLKSDILFKIISDRMAREPELAEKLKATFQFNITRRGKIVAKWTTDSKNELAVYRSEPKNNVKPDCTVTVDDEDFASLVMGKLSPARAFIMGKVSLDGDVSLLHKLSTMRDQLRSQGRAPELDTASDILENGALKGLRCDAMIIEMISRLARAPQLIQDLKHIFRMHILKNQREVAVYTVNLKEKRPTVCRGAGQSDSASDCEFYLEDDDLVRLMYRKLDLKEAVDADRVKLSGDRDVAFRLSKLFTNMLSSVSKL